ncbi:imidazole glycerol phosphate synthase subunit HisH [Methylomonas rivi]|uniref:Imidazole glycerol phosphate synthase subunit HisH n=1 Tax=Methylomonas rivi TaxID=2952226 RepID=A0ABT1U3Z2_9GAMM|nr:imidazole glycerol phosphate synthase subunit HisH [Methylomonas sp. WSC-6]MBS4052450.1 imidazole glycerol phosphate synthase subunit HisH [Methylomonas sp.]MCQ8128149.1 imidazole glycerol phosphate synthase subunit HisH [Methylomonas sp. WSC-6]
MSSVAVIDYGMGNLHSIAKALQHADPQTQVQISADAKVIQDADRVVFPGVGAIRDCMQSLRALNLVEPIMQAAREKPFLGVCLGMQALLTDSEENGGIGCLNLFPGHVRRFTDGLRDQHGGILKVPHMGWNRVKQKSHPLWHNIAQDSRFYFVHSYFVTPDREEDSIATSDYPDPFTCALARDNMFAVQFHPEKSQEVGLQLLQNFLRWDGAA